MAITELTPEVPERGTQILTLQFEDENDVTVVPNTVQTSLTDGAGNIVNSHDGDSQTPATTLTVVYSGDDHDLTVNADQERVFLVYWEYNSATAGSNLPASAQRKYYITNQVKAN